MLVKTVETRICSVPQTAVSQNVSNRYRGSSSHLVKTELHILTLLIIKLQEKTWKEKQVASCLPCSGKEENQEPTSLKVLQIHMLSSLFCFLLMTAPDFAMFSQNSSERKVPLPGMVR